MDESFKKVFSLLLAEDDESLRQTLSLYLASEGFRVFQAQTGIEAVEVALENKVSFSIMDINLPGLSGIAALRKISEQAGRMPCIFMSGDASPDSMLKALNAGGFTFLSKPIQIELMRYTLDRLIDKYFGGGNPQGF